MSAGLRSRSGKRGVVFTPPDHIRILGPDEELEGGEALPGFRCMRSEIFG